MSIARAFGGLKRRVHACNAWVALKDDAPKPLKMSRRFRDGFKEGGMNMDVAVHVIGRDDDPSGRDWQALLQEVVAYRNDQVVFRFCRHFDIGRHEASCILEQVMKWLWLCEYNRQCNPAPIRLHIDRPLKIIDEMWHNLILHTQDYAALCERFFGSFVDHFPATEADYSAHEDRRSSMSAEAFAHEQIQRRRPQYTMVYDLLGEQTFRTWYVEYPRTYTPELIRSLRR